MEIRLTGTKWTIQVQIEMEGDKIVLPKQEFISMLEQLAFVAESWCEGVQTVQGLGSRDIRLKPMEWFKKEIAHQRMLEESW